MAENVTPPAQGEEGSVQQGSTSERLREKLGGCIRTGEITLSSGKVTDFYFDGRLVSLDPEGSVLIAELMLDAVEARGSSAVGGQSGGHDGGFMFSRLKRSRGRSGLRYADFNLVGIKKLTYSLLVLLVRDR